MAMQVIGIGKRRGKAFGHLAADYNPSMDITRRQWALASMAAAASCDSGGDSAPSTARPDNPGQPAPRHVIDLHCDTPMLLRDGSYDLGARNTRGEVDIPRMRDGGVTGVFFSIYTSATRNTELESVQQALEIIDAVRREVSRFPGDLALATSSDEIEAARRSGHIAIVMGVEGGHMINSSLAVLRSLYELGARYLTLTHSKDTPWAGSSGSDANLGLSDFGRSVIREMNRLGMLVDISHVSDQTFWDVLDTSAAPIIASHSSARALAAHKRNMSDEMIRAMADKGGVIHINYYNVFIDDAYAARSNAWNRANPDIESGDRDARTRAKLAAIGRPPLDTLLDHFDPAIQVAGIEGVGLGSDFDGVDGELPQDKEDISQVPNIADGLARRNYSQDE
ncbi:MAG: membrane dipeptidase, partial [Acidobacteriia bacterium]|nr:membrane dipeptidase [Terriglobia bacterium]